MRIHLVAAVFIASLGLASQLAPWVRSLDRWVLDNEMVWLRSHFPRVAPAEIVIVGIDDESYERLPEPFALWHPYFGRAFAALAGAGAKAVLVDIVLPAKRYRDFLPGTPGADHDRTLLEGMNALRTATPPIPLYLGQVMEGPCPRALLAPVMALATGLGVISLPVDDDGVIRSYRGSLPVSAECPGNVEGAYPSLATTAASQLGYATADGLIDYSIDEPYSYIPFHRLAASSAAHDPTELRRQFADKIVVLGGVSRFEDRVQMPMPLAAWEPGHLLLPGVLAHAQALRTTLYHGHLVSTHRATAMLLVMLLAPVMWLLSRRLATGLAAAGLTVASLLVVSTWALLHGAAVPVAAGIATTVLACVTRWSYESAKTFADRRRMRAAFGSYVSPNVMKEIEQGAIHSTVAGKLIRVCVLFSDIRGFTERNEHVPPEDTIRFLNLYFAEMAAAVHQHGGTVDKFLGDGLMAFFGAPNELPYPSRNAFAAVKEMFARLKVLNDGFRSRGLPSISIGVGLNTGEVIVGHVGSSERHEYTVIGDHVNLAARLEGKTKELGFPMVCTEAVVREVGAEARFQLLGPQSIKGHSAVEIYGWRPEE